MSFCTAGDLTCVQSVLSDFEAQCHVQAVDLLGLSVMAKVPAEAVACIFSCKPLLLQPPVFCRSAAEALFRRTLQDVTGMLLHVSEAPVAATGQQYL